MAGKLGKFQMQGFQYWKGISKENHISAAYLSQPQKATDLMVQMLAFQRGKSLETFLSKFPVKEFETDDDFYWDIISSSRRNIPLVEARTEDGQTITTEMMAGAGFAPFYLVFGEDWFSKGEVLWGNLNEVYPIRVLEEPKFEGTNTVYKVQVYGTNANGVPGERLQAGERFSIAYAPVSRNFSRAVGDIRFSTPVSMRNEWSQIRIHHKVGGNMIDKKLAVGIPVVKDTLGNKIVHDVKNYWMHVVDYELEVQFSEAKNNVLAWGVSTRNGNGEYTNFDIASGEPVKAGDGLFAQMEVANTYYYNKFSLKLLTDALYMLSTSKLGMNERTFIIKTGEMGALQFNEEMNKLTSGWTQYTLDNSSIGVIQKAQSPLHENALKAGWQFTEYVAPNGVHVKIEVDPMYDDVVRNKVLHPNGGVAYSYRYDIFDIGTMDQPNIQKCVIKNRPEYRGYQAGLRNPFTGQINNNYMSYDEDSAIIHKMATLGICVLDPTRTMSLIPAVLQG